MSIQFRYFWHYSSSKLLCSNEQSKALIFYLQFSSILVVSIHMIQTTRSLNLYELRTIRVPLEIKNSIWLCLLQECFTWKQSLTNRKKLKNKIKEQIKEKLIIQQYLSAKVLHTHPNLNISFSKYLSFEVESQTN